MMVLMSDELNQSFGFGIVLKRIQNFDKKLSTLSNKNSRLSYYRPKRNTHKITKTNKNLPNLPHRLAVVAEVIIRLRSFDSMRPISTISTHFRFFKLDWLYICSPSYTIKIIYEKSQSTERHPQSHTYIICWLCRLTLWHFNVSQEWNEFEISTKWKTE